MSYHSGGMQLLIRRGFKFELKPNGMQIQLMKQFCGCARYVYNRTLSLEKSLYKKDSKHSFKYTAAANRLPGWKKESFFKEMPQPGASAVIKGFGTGLYQFFRETIEFSKIQEKVSA